MTAELTVWGELGERMKELVEGRDGAWDRLLALAHPELERIASRQPLGRLRDDVDVHRDIVTKVIDKLHRDDHRAIAKFVAHDDPPPLEAWVRVLVRNAAIDIMRTRPEFVRGKGAEKPGWLSLATLATVDGAPVANSIEAKRREVESHLAAAIVVARDARDELGAAAAADKLAREWKIPVLHSRRLIKKLELYEAVLPLVFAGHSLVEVAEMLGQSRREIELVVDYLEQFFHASGFAD